MTRATRSASIRNRCALVEITHRDFVRAGAELSPENKDKLRAMNTELAELETTFSQNVLAEVNANAIVVDSREELVGLSDAEIQAAADEAVTRDLRANTCCRCSTPADNRY